MTREWSSSYNFHTLQLSHGLTVHVDWEKDGYRVHFCGAVLKKRFQSLPEAKAAAIRLANSCLHAALEDLQVWAAPTVKS